MYQVIELDTQNTLEDTFQLSAALNCVLKVIQGKPWKKGTKVYFLNGNISGK